MPVESAMSTSCGKSLASRRLGAAWPKSGGEAPNKAINESKTVTRTRENPERDDQQGGDWVRVTMEDTAAARTWPAFLRVAWRPDVLCPSTCGIRPFRAGHDRVGSGAQR